MFTYNISVATGKQALAGTINHIYLTLVGTKGCSDRTLLDKCFFEHFGRETVVSVDIKVNEFLGDIVLVKLEKEKILIDDHWYCRSISVTSPSGDGFEFPCYRWISSEKEVILRDGKGLLPQDDNMKEYRQVELQYRQQQFRWKEWRTGFPLSIDANNDFELPLDVKFEAEKTVDFYSNAIKAIGNLGLNELLKLLQSSWKDIEDFKKIFVTMKNTVSEHVMQNWDKDLWFGYQFLNGCNPVMISKCRNLPNEFAVTQDMVKCSLDRGLTLQEELKAGNIYIADYAILEGVQANDTDPHTKQYLAAPFCLLYKNSQNDIVPIAIQLSRQTTAEVFLPSDNKYDWMLAKMWVKSSDFNAHQLVTHLFRTHLISEVFAIAMYRQLPAVHPVFKLLIPHIRYTIAINTAARETLICESGVFDKANAGGGKQAIGEVIQKAMKTLTYKSLCLPEDIKARGVDNKEDLPNYYYRDDGMMVWEVVKSFVSDVVKIYYSSDKTVQEDEEIQAFVQDVCFSGMKNGPSNCEFPNSLNTCEQLVEYLTVVIFTASAQHAAVNFGQYDWFAWIPNSPSTMRMPPPTQKGQVDMKYIMESLPDRTRSCWHLGAVWALSQFQEEVYLGVYPDLQFTEQSVKEAIKSFQKKLFEVTNSIKSRKEKLQLPYRYLSPDRIPNSVAI